MAEGTSHSDLNLLRPDDINADNLPVVMRGYDKHEVERRLNWAKESYARVLQQRDVLRERVDAVDERAQAAEGEAKANAKEVADLAQRAATAEDQLAQARERLERAETELRRADAERKLALDDMRTAKEDAVRLQSRVDALEAALRTRGESAPSPQPTQASAASDAEAGALLVAATRVSEDLRIAARTEAQKTMRKARERAEQLTAEAEQERKAAEDARRRASELAAQVENARKAADEALDRRRAAEREAREILAQARLEAERTLGSLDEERQRVRRLLTDALASLEAEAGEETGSVLADLSARLRTAE